MIPADTLMISTAVSLAALFLGWWLFTRNADQIAYRT
jgi:ABC-type polysaccharide/polyol phosphate export permease